LIIISILYYNTAGFPKNLLMIFSFPISNQTGVQSKTVAFCIHSVHYMQITLQTKLREPIYN